MNALRAPLLVIAATLSASMSDAQAEALTACTARPVSEIQYTTGGITEISADSGHADLANERLTFTGEVEVLQNARRVTADQIVYNQRSDIIDATGSVTLAQPGLILMGDEGHLDLGKDYARLKPLRYELPEIGGRGEGSKGESLGDGKFEARHVNFTTCEPGDDSWYLSAKELKVDRNRGLATAHNAKLRFKGVPVLATPWLQFPIDDRRMTGFLIPEAGYSSRNGFDLRLPYYLNLAPNYDATLYPRFIEKRGLLLGTEFRYLFGDHRGTIYAEALPNDQLYQGDNDLRGKIAMTHLSQFSDRLRGQLVVNAVSDEDYLEDLGGNLGVSSTVYLNSTAQLTYLGDNWTGIVNWQKQDVLDDSDEPLSRSPQLLYLTSRELTDDIDLNFTGEFVNFERTGAPAGPRVDLYPTLTADFRRIWGFVRPRISGRYTRYDLDGVAAGVPQSQDRSLYAVSIDSGLFFERNTEFFLNSGIQTLEPRVFYLYTPYRDQSDIPLFDTAEPELTFANLFAENRFTGADRVGDANQLTLALSSRFIEDASHRQRFSASIGQIFYFEDRRVQLNANDEIQTEKSSPLLSELDLTLSEEWSTNAIVQYDFDDAQVENTLVRLRYRSHDNRRALNLAYRYDPESEQEYTDIAFALPLTSRYRAVGRWQYSQSDNRTMEALGGLEYDTCCWRVRGAVRHYLSDADTNYDTAFFIQLELKGLTRLGDDIDQLLNRSVYGYSLLDGY